MHILVDKNTKVFRTLGTAAVAFGLLASASALAGPDGLWVDPSGGISGLRVEGDPVVPLKPGNRTLAEIVKGFDRLCLGTDFDKLKVNPVIVGSEWSGQYMPSLMTTASGEVDLGGWQGNDHSLLIAKDVFFSPNPQCVLTVATARKYSAVEFFPVLTARFGQPANFAEMFGADGKPNDSVRPHWILPAPAANRERVLFARTLSRGTDYRIHMALIERPKAS